MHALPNIWKRTRSTPRLISTLVGVERKHAPTDATVRPEAVPREWHAFDVGGFFFVGLG